MLSLLGVLLACAKSEPAVERGVAAEARVEAPDVDAPDVEPPAAEEAAPISIELPKQGAVVRGDLLGARGTARVFEGRILVRLRQDDAVLVSESVQVSAGAPQEGTWRVQLDLPEGASGLAVLEAYRASAKDGSEQDLVAVGVDLQR